MNTDIKERLRLYNQQVVFFHNYRSSYALILKAIEATQLRETPNCALITGPSGTGKSTLLNYFESVYPSPHYIQTEHDRHLVIPVVKCTLPPASTVKAFLKTILTNLRCESVEGDTVDLIFRLITLLRTSKVQAVLIDEFQFLIKKDAYRTQEAVTNCLVLILDQAKIPFILVGRDEKNTESLYYKSCETFIYQRDDLARRFPFHAKLELLTYNNLPDSEYQTVLSELDAQLYQIGALGSGIHLMDPGVSERLYLASCGNLENIKNITFHALQICLKNKNSGLTTGYLAQAYAILKIKNDITTENPFLMSNKTCEDIIESL